jgi:hypothetical protein
VSTAKWKKNEKNPNPDFGAGTLAGNGLPNDAACLGASAGVRRLNIHVMHRVREPWSAPIELDRAR